MDDHRNYDVLETRIKAVEKDMADAKSLAKEVAKRPTVSTLLVVAGLLWGVSSFILSYFLSGQAVTIKELKIQDAVLSQRVDTQYSSISDKMTSLCIQIARLESKVDQLDRVRKY